MSADVLIMLQPSKLNQKLTELMPGLTAKVFRTYNASVTMEQQLGTLPAESIIKVKELEYNRANREVAVLCNHQRTVSAAFGAQYAKMSSKVWKFVPRFRFMLIG